MLKHPSKLELTSETLSYASSVDGTQPPLADVAFDDELARQWARDHA